MQVEEEANHRPFLSPTMLFSLATLALAFVSGANAACERVQDVAVRVAAFPGGNSTIFCASWKSAWCAYMYMTAGSQWTEKVIL